MSKQPLLPVQLAAESIHELKGFVSALLYSRDVNTREAILKCLFEDDPMVKGPFLQIKLPFRFADDEFPLDPAIGEAQFSGGKKPYLHQIKAFQRLKSGVFKPTLVTTGTGSGKSECFSLPIMDYVLKCKRQGKAAGVKALIIYPMNALIEDQAERLSELANKLNETILTGRSDLEKIRVGRYTGFRGTTTKHDPKSPKQVIDHRRSLCENPPDILLTNYRMLDFMLMRPEEQSFWGEKTKEVFQYLVLDELHTFDGAQGADVACLIRRLRLKLELIRGQRSITCVGTSATVAHGGDETKAKSDLCEFAGTLFGDTFTIDSIIEEDRLSIDESLNLGENLRVQETGEVTPPAHMAEILKKWSAPSDLSQLAHWITKHQLTRTILLNLENGDSLPELAQKVKQSQDQLIEYLAILGWARNATGSFALFPLNAQLWARGTRFLMRALRRKPEFVRPEALKGNDVDRSKVHLPAVTCRSCGVGGWIADVQAMEPQRGKNSGETRYYLNENTSEIISKYDQKRAQILFARKYGEGANQEGQYYFDVDQRTLMRGEAPEDTDNYVPLFMVHQDLHSAAPFVLFKKKGGGDVPIDCPECDERLSLALGVMGTSMLGSVLGNTFLSSKFNPSDRKYLVFNDSVQDAHHQAGYLSARGARFNIRRFIYQRLLADQAAGKTLTLADSLARIRQHVEQLWVQAQRENHDSRAAKEYLLNIIPKDLWERWQSEKQTKIFQNNDLKSQVIDRLEWEAWVEFTMNSDLGWSLRKTALVLLEPSAKMLKVWTDTLKAVAHTSSPYKSPKNPEGFCYGLIRRMLKQGAVFHPELKSSLSKQRFSIWPLRSTKPFLTSVFEFRFPHAMTTKTNVGGGDTNIETLCSKYQTWYNRWAEKHELTKDEAITLYNELLKRLRNLRESGIVPANSESDPERFTLDPGALTISVDHAELRRCNTCSNLQAIEQHHKDVSLMCTQVRCKGEMKPNLDESDLKAEREYRSYMKSHYEKDLVTPFAHPHTGQLTANDRKKVEQAFKLGLIPDDPLDGKNSRSKYHDQPVNILTCTPTMEMGIDIGSLSGVALRSFPPTPASAMQRLGRSGRSSGNSFNTIILRNRPHDLAFWADPNMFFKAKVQVPGCEYRNPQLLLRQFNAYVFDEYARRNPELKIPQMEELQQSEKLGQTPFWRGLKAFLGKPNPEIIHEFATYSLSGPVESPLAVNDLKRILTESWKNGELLTAIEEALVRVDRDRAYLQSAQQAANTDTEQGAPTTDDTRASGDTESTARAREVHRFKKWQEDSSEDTYILKVLADRGILPNYAFPEEGVRFSYSVRVRKQTRDPTDRKPFRFINGEIQRPPRAGLLELAPNAVYYADGFKLPVTRIDKAATQNKLFKAIVCEGCAAVTRLPETAPPTVDCPSCNTPLPVINVINYYHVVGDAHFERAQIRDSEDEREHAQTMLQTFRGQPSEPPLETPFKTWISPAARIAFEMNINGELHFLNRNYAFGGIPQEYTVCSECWAVPYRPGDNNTFIFKEEYNSINRHHFACKYFSNPNSADIKVMRVSLGRSLKSDSISFLVDSSDRIPTIKATLNLAMKKYLKGEADHLMIERLQINNTDAGTVRHFITLYDNVPGGTGHLRSLMQLSENTPQTTDAGLSQLKRIFRETKNHIEACPCQNGCYSCLHSFNNQFDHEHIFKGQAIAWLNRFIAASDWTLKTSALTTELQNQVIFGSPLEDEFIDFLTKGSLRLSGVTRIVPIAESGKRAFQIIGPDIRERTVLLATADDDVRLPGFHIPYTKPDFTLYVGGKVAAYIYIDGRAPHLGQGKAETCPFWEIDKLVRPRLMAELHGSRARVKRVITLTSDMVAALGKTPVVPPDSPRIAKQLAQNLFDISSGRRLDASTSKWLYHEAAKAALEEVILQKQNLLVNDRDRSDLRTFLEQLKGRLKPDGLLQIDKQNFLDVISDSKLRIDENLAVRDEYALAWNYYWLFWMALAN